MTPGYNIDISSIKAQVSHYRSDPKLGKKLKTAISKLEINPASGSLMARVPVGFEGCVWKIDTGGRKGYRLFYVWPPGTEGVTCVILQRRSELEYDKIDWDRVLCGIPPPRS